MKFFLRIAPSFFFFLFSSIGLLNSISAQTYDPDWETVLHAIVDGDDLISTNDDFSWAESKNILPAGQDGWIECTVIVPNSDYMIGLSPQGRAAHWTTIESAIYDRRPAFIHAYHDGVERTLVFENSEVGDVLRVERIGSTAYYKRNGVVIGSNSISTGELVGIGYISFHSSFTTVIKDIELSFPAPGQSTNLPTGNCDPNVFFHASPNGITINDTLYARKIIVALCPFPDYVFGDEYNLMPLNELDDFIKENKHLPSIPSAAEVAKNNIALDDLAIKQMEKIEELTLYLLEMNKRMEKLELENKALKKAFEEK